ncbi:hypothetical protein AVEN_200042-1, partial [Araneus ventricosus]
SLKTDHGVRAVFFVLTNDIWTYQWSAKLNDNNTVFQGELTELHEAVKYASHQPNHNTCKIHLENRASIMTSSNSRSTNQTARQIFKIRLRNIRMKVWKVNAHAGNIGNERADQLAKGATQHGKVYTLTSLLKPDKLPGTMEIQTGKSITSCHQLVFAPLTGLERILSSSLITALSLPNSKGFTSLTAINAVVAELALHFTMSRSVPSQCLGV